jgi:hypothetical protein
MYELYFGCKVWDQDELSITFMLQQVFAIFTWLAHWHSPINAFRSPSGMERTAAIVY